MSVNDAWMPLYLGDYLADTMHLNAAQHGAYLLLLMHYWRNGPLPDDDAQLAAIARCDIRLWKTVGPVVRGFFRANNGVLHQKRMDQERAKWSSISDKRRDAGRAGAQAKWKPNGSHPPPGPNVSRAANASTSPVDNFGSSLYNSVDKYGNRIANAIDLPSICHDTCTSTKILSLPLKEVVPPRESELAPEGADIDTAKRADEVIGALANKLGRVAYAPGRKSALTQHEQIAVLTPRPAIKPRPLSREHLARLGHRKVSS